MEDVVSNYEHIQVSPSKINDIIGAIDGIAFQTGYPGASTLLWCCARGRAGRALPWWSAKCAAWRSAARRTAQRDQGPDQHQRRRDQTLRGRGGARGRQRCRIVTNADHVRQLDEEVKVRARAVPGIAQIGMAIQG